MITIRRYISSDIQTMLDVRRRSITKICARDYAPAQIDAWAGAALNQNLESQDKRFRNSTTWVAMIDDKLVGYINLGDVGYIDCLYVDADTQGRGVATVLLAELEKTATAIGVTRLHSEVSITARPFFERRGFSVVAAQIVTSYGLEYRNFRMEKQLIR